MKQIFNAVFFCCFSITAFGQPNIDTNKTDYARFIAGLPCYSQKYIAIQQKLFYQDHLKVMNKILHHIQDSSINKINDFVNEKKLTELIDTITCFYPFGGPDFLFANVFYPYAKNYVLMGLEKPGTIPDLTLKSEEEIKGLLNHLKECLLYLNKSGYFVTAHMSKDFSKSMLNGTIHPVLLFAAYQGYKVCSIKNGYINKLGVFVEYNNKNDREYYNGYRLSLIDSSQNIQNVYYFSSDIADYKIKSKNWFVPFVKSFGKCNSYLKSASYIPAHKNFSVVRNLILLNSNKIIQDDTGIPFKILNEKSKWDLDFWGTYTMTIKDLSWGFQPDLKDAVSKSDNNKKLPFRISYNGNYGEGIIMIARKKF